jgi:RNA polymerase sigma-70 factor (ECF subfamily)
LGRRTRTTERIAWIGLSTSTGREVTLWRHGRLPLQAYQPSDGRIAMRGTLQRPRGGEGEPAADGTDELLVAAAQRGDPRAFALLYDRYQDRVLRYCFYRLGTWDEAGDAAQQVFTDALGGLARFHDRDDAFRTWLFRIAHNEVADRHRRRARRADADLAEAIGLADPAPSPDALAVAADEGRALRAMLARLPDEQRAVSELRLAELSGPEIARVLGISHAAVRKAQSRAVARLREFATAGDARKEAPRG